MKWFQEWRSVALITAVAYLWHILLFAFGGRFAPGFIAYAAWLPLVFAPIWALGAAVRLLQPTLQQGGKAMERPRAALRVIGVDLGMILVHVVVFSALVFVGALILFSSTLGVAGLIDVLPIPSLGWVVGLLVRVWLVGLLVTLVLAAMAQFAFLFSRMGDRFAWLMGTWVFVIVSWIAIRVVPVLGQWLQWLPDFRFHDVYLIGEVFEFHPVLVESGPWGALLLFLLAVIVASAYLMASDPVRDRYAHDSLEAETVASGGS